MSPFQSQTLLSEIRERPLVSQKKRKIERKKEAFPLVPSVHEKETSSLSELILKSLGLQPVGRRPERLNLIAFERKLPVSTAHWLLVHSTGLSFFFFFLAFLLLIE